MRKSTYNFELHSHEKFMKLKTCNISFLQVTACPSPVYVCQGKVIVSHLLPNQVTVKPNSL